MDFYKAFEKVIGHEGGYVNDPTDPGGETKYGVSKRAYPNVDIKGLTLKDAQKIYYSDYWLKTKCDAIPDKLRYIHFDTAINMGRSKAAKTLQQAAGVKDDGIIGSQTLEAAKGVNKSTYAFIRALNYMYIIGRNKSLAKYSKGWANRLKDVYNT